MTDTVGELPALIIADRDRATGSRVLHWLSPVLIAVAAPAIALLVAAPSSVANARVLVVAVLFAVFLVAATAYVLSVLLPGSVSRIEMSAAARTVRLTQRGLLATSATTIPFTRIANVRVATRYDDDGFGADVAELVLIDGTAIGLPSATSPEDLTALKQAIGLG